MKDFGQSTRAAGKHADGVPLDQAETGRRIFRGNELGKFHEASKGLVQVEADDFASLDLFLNRESGYGQHATGNGLVQGNGPGRPILSISDRAVHDGRAGPSG